MALSRKQAIIDAAAALRIARPDLNEKASQVVLAAAIFESGYGTLAMKNGFLMPDGSPSHNWGGRKGEGNAGCIMHGDSDEHGLVCFSRYSSAAEGAKGFFHTRAWGVEPFASNTIAAASAGSAWGVAQAMHDAGYYSGFRCDGKSVFPIDKDPEQNWCRINGYARAIMGSTKEIAAALGQPHYFAAFDGPARPSSSGGGGLLLAGLAAAGIYWFGFRK